MKNEYIYPLLFEPVYKDYIWGGRRIPLLYNRDTDQEICAESWEISDRPEGMSVVKNGALSGKTLHDVIQEYGADITGIEGESFPLLIKLIDARQRLSVQVHPNDETAAQYGGEAKTECWLNLTGDEGAAVFAGFQPGTDSDNFREALEAEELEKMLCKVPAVEGEAIYIPGGRTHAIAEGCLLLEVQQNSNTTYRVYDWGRVGHDGQPRELHIEEAFQVINWDDAAPEPSKPEPLVSDSPNSWYELISSPYFHLTRVDLAHAEALQRKQGTFRALFVTEGNVKVTGNDVTEEVGPGTSILLPAALEECEIEPVDGTASVISVTL